MTTIAGHTFVYGLCNCGVRWIDIRYADESYMMIPYCWNADDPDAKWKKIAHAGLLNAEELEQIRVEVKAEDKRIADAVADIGMHR